MKKSLNYIKPTLARCVVWSQFAHEKMKLQKSMFAKKATALYMNGEDEEMAALMPDFYAGEFKKSYSITLHLGLKQKIESLKNFINTL